MEALTATGGHSPLTALILVPMLGAVALMLVPKEQLGRAGGMVQIGEAISQLASPAIAGGIFVGWGLQGIIMIDFNIPDWVPAWAVLVLAFLAFAIAVAWVFLPFAVMSIGRRIDKMAKTQKETQRLLKRISQQTERE